MTYLSSCGCTNMTTSKRNLNNEDNRKFFQNTLNNALRRHGRLVVFVLFGGVYFTSCASLFDIVESLPAVSPGE